MCVYYTPCFVPCIVPCIVPWYPWRTEYSTLLNYRMSLSECAGLETTDAHTFSHQTCGTTHVTHRSKPHHTRHQHSRSRLPAPIASSRSPVVFSSTVATTTGHFFGLHLIRCQCVQTQTSVFVHLLVLSPTKPIVAFRKGQDGTRTVEIGRDDWHWILYRRGWACFQTLLFTNVPDVVNAVAARRHKRIEG